MNVATVPGVAATHRPVVGDFDGNGTSDIAVVQKKDGCSNCLTTLPIAMSRGDGRFLVTNVDSGDVRMLQHSFGTRSLPQSTFVGNFVSEQ
jgi:hypothetical protein